MIKVYKCSLCGNVTLKLTDGQGPLSCCGQEMTLMTANSTDAAQEKHVPVLSLTGDLLTVTVGEVIHPMTAEHHIGWILVEQGDKVQYVTLSPELEPKAEFKVDSKEKFTVYEYCNLHGLWKAER